VRGQTAAIGCDVNTYAEQAIVVSRWHRPIDDHRLRTTARDRPPTKQFLRRRQLRGGQGLCATAAWGKVEESANDNICDRSGSVFELARDFFERRVQSAVGRLRIIHARRRAGPPKNTNHQVPLIYRPGTRRSQRRRQRRRFADKSHLLGNWRIPLVTGPSPAAGLLYECPRHRPVDLTKALTVLRRTAANAGRGIKSAVTISIKSPLCQMTVFWRIKAVGAHDDEAADRRRRGRRKEEIEDCAAPCSASSSSSSSGVRACIRQR
jgi:hypothetical protein